MPLLQRSVFNYKGTKSTRTTNTIHLCATLLQGVKASSAFALPKPRVVADAVCGAPAQALAAAEEQKLAEQTGEDGKHLDSASDWEVRQQKN